MTQGEGGAVSHRGRQVHGACCPPRRRPVRSSVPLSLCGSSGGWIRTLWLWLAMDCRDQSPLGCPLDCRQVCCFGFPLLGKLVLQFSRGGQGTRRRTPHTLRSFLGQKECRLLSGSAAGVGAEHSPSAVPPGPGGSGPRSPRSPGPGGASEGVCSSLTRDFPLQCRHTLSSCQFEEVLEIP